MRDTLIGLLVFGGLTAGGFAGIFWRALIHSLDTENDSTANDSTAAPSPQQLWAVRISSVVMFLMGCVGLYAVLTWDGTPPDGPLF